MWVQEGKKQDGRTDGDSRGSRASMCRYLQKLMWLHAVEHDDVACCMPHPTDRLWTDWLFVHRDNELNACHDKLWWCVCIPCMGVCCLITNDIIL